MNNKKITYTTIVNSEYLPYLKILLKTHKKFCNINLIVYTINFDYQDTDYENVKFIRYDDFNLIEYEEKGFNKFIRNDYEKHKYTTFLKPIILQNPSDDYDYFFFIDVDGLLTKNSDSLVLNSIFKYGYTNIPISVKYFYDYSNTHDVNIPVYNGDGSFNEQSLSYYHLNKLYGLKYSGIPYITTYCIFYTKYCSDFLKEVEQICFDEEVRKDYKKYLPLGDETAFNLIYSKYNIKEYISDFLCYDISPFKKIEHVKDNIEKINDYVSFIHTKRLNKKIFYGSNLDINLSEYDIIIDSLSKTLEHDSKINIIKVEDDKIHFCVNDGYNQDLTVRLVSKFNLNKHLQYLIKIDDNCCYWIAYNNKSIKDLYLLINDYKLNIKDSIKIY